MKGFSFRTPKTSCSSRGLWEELKITAQWVAKMSPVQDDDRAELKQGKRVASWTLTFPRVLLKNCVVGLMKQHICMCSKRVVMPDVCLYKILLLNTRSGTRSKL